MFLAPIKTMLPRLHLETRFEICKQIGNIYCAWRSGSSTVQNGGSHKPTKLANKCKWPSLLIANKEKGKRNHSIRAKSNAACTNNSLHKWNSNLQKIHTKVDTKLGFESDTREKNTPDLSAELVVLRGLWDSAVEFERLNNRNCTIEMWKSWDLWL